MLKVVNLKKIRYNKFKGEHNKFKLNSKENIILLLSLDPRPPEGSYKINLVCPSVSPSVSSAFLSGVGH